MRFTLKHLGVGLFAVLVITLVLGAHFGFTWAGGNGYMPTFDITTLEEQGDVVATPDGAARRGSVVTTGKDARMLFQIDDALVALYEDTTVEFKTLSGEIEIVVQKGRVAVSSGTQKDRPLVVSAGPIQTITFGGTFSLVHYDFQQRVSVIPLSGPVGVNIADESGQVIMNPIDISTVPPYEVTDTTFTPAGSAAENFYAWFQAKVDQPSSDLLQP